MSWDSPHENREDRAGTGAEGSVERTQSRGDASGGEGLPALPTMPVFATAHRRIAAPHRHLEGDMESNRINVMRIRLRCASFRTESVRRTYIFLRTPLFPA